MKLLGWMHRKFRQNTGEPLKDFVIGHPPSDDQQQYFRRTSMNKPFKQAQITGLNLTKSLSGTCLDAAISDQDHHESQVSANIDSEIFPGFLAIGTLGSSSDPATPKFSISIDYITERDQTEVTQNDLNLINHELEKVLEAKLDDGGSRRNSNGNNTESNINGANGGDVAVICPLQGYLFGSAVELSETTAVGKKENRISLGELFQKSKVSEKVGGGRSCEKEGDKYAIQFIKKKLKKRMFGAANSKSSLSSTAAAGVLDVSTHQTKLHKILHLFNRSKVYPESSTMIKEKLDQKAQKKDKKKKTNIDGANKNNGDRTSTEEDIMIFPKKLIFKKTLLPHYKSKSIPPQFSEDDYDDADSIWNKEQWIKTE